MLARMGGAGEGDRDDRGIGGGEDDGDDRGIGGDEVDGAARCDPDGPLTRGGDIRVGCSERACSRSRSAAASCDDGGVDPGAEERGASQRTVRLESSMRACGSSSGVGCTCACFALIAAGETGIVTCSSLPRTSGIRPELRGGSSSVLPTSRGAFSTSCAAGPRSTVRRFSSLRASGSRLGFGRSPRSSESIIVECTSSTNASSCGDIRRRW